MLIFILIQITYQLTEQIQLKHGESIHISTLNHFVDYLDEFQQIGFLQNGQIAILVDEFQLLNYQNIISIKFYSNQYLQTEIFYTTNHSNIYYFQILSQENTCQKQNNIFQINTFGNQLIQLTIPNQICYDHLYDNIDSTLIIICYSLQQQILSIRKYSEIQLIEEIKLSENISAECTHQLVRLLDQFYLVSCLGTKDWAVYQFSFQQNSSYSKFLDIKYFQEQAIIENEKIMNELRIGKNTFYLFEEQYVLCVNKQNIFLFFYKKILQFSIVSGNAMILTIQGIYNIDIQRKVTQEYISNNETLNSLLETKSLEYISFSPNFIFYNESHLFINNFYKNIDIEHINYWERDQNLQQNQSCLFEIISIFSNHSIYLYQVPELKEVVQMQGKRITLKNQSQNLQRIFLNLDESYFSNIYQIQDQIINVYQREVQQFNINLKYFPVIQFSYNIQGEQLVTNISTRIDSFYLNQQLIDMKNKTLIQLEIYTNTTIWIVSKNSSLYIVLCYSQQRCIEYFLINNQYQQEQLFYSGFQYSDNYLMIIVIQNQISNNLKIVQFETNMYKNFLNLVAESRFQFKQKLIAIIQPQVNKIFYLKTKQNFYTYDAASQKLNLSFNMVNYGQILINNYQLIFSDNILYLSNLKDITNQLNQFDTGLLNIFNCELLSLTSNEFLLICQSNQQITYIQHYFIDQYYSIVLLKTIIISKYVVSYPYKIKQISSYFIILEVFDQNKNQTYILLYDFSYPQIYCLRYQTIKLSDNYFLETNGKLVYIFHDRIDIIYHNQLTIQQQLPLLFNQKFEIKSQIKLNLEYPLQNMTLIFDIKYYEYLLDIVVPITRKTIQYQSNQINYKLPIQQWSYGVIENITLSKNNYQILPPIEMLSDLSFIGKEIVYLRDNYVLYKPNTKSYFQYGKLEYNPQNKDISFIISDIIYENSAETYQTLSKLEINSRIFLIVFNYIYNLQYLCIIYELNIDNNKFQYFGELQFVQNYAIQLLVTNQHYIFLKHYNYFILYELAIINNSIQIVQWRQFNISDYQSHIEENNLYISELSEYELIIYQISRENIILENLYNITYPSSNQEKFTNYYIYNITENSALVLLYQKSNFLLLVQYSVLHDTNKYLYLKKPYLNLVNKYNSYSTIILGNLILIEYITSFNSDYFVYYIHDAQNHDIIFPCQKLVGNIIKPKKIWQSIYLFQKIQTASILQINDGYSLIIKEVREKNIDLILSNQYNQQLIQVLIVKSKLQYIWIIIISGFFLQLYLYKLI